MGNKVQGPPPSPSHEPRLHLIEEAFVSQIVNKSQTCSISSTFQYSGGSGLRFWSELLLVVIIILFLLHTTMVYGSCYGQCGHNPAWSCGFAASRTCHTNTVRIPCVCSHGATANSKELLSGLPMPLLSIPCRNVSYIFASTCHATRGPPKLPIVYVGAPRVWLLKHVSNPLSFLHSDGSEKGGGRAVDNWLARGVLAIA